MADGTLLNSVIVTVQTGAPGGSYVTPLIYDNTAVTGGLYAWDGGTYQKVTPAP